MRVVVASGNSGKVREFAELLAGSRLDPIAPADLGIALDLAETGTSYIENALIKAQGYVKASGLPSLADDSGIEVEALGGAPGIFSARYGGPGLTDEDRTARLLEEMKSVAPGRRGARYYCALALLLPDGTRWLAEGISEGEIARAPSGSNGFGYDPIFVVPELDRTMAELSAEEKNQLSHRARAVRNLLASLKVSGGA
jgi:XTP/dITP diphosphohydrolase